VSSGDEETPFSEQIQRWLDEGDKLGDAHAQDGGRPASGSAAPKVHAAAMRAATKAFLNRDRSFIVGAALVGGVIVLVLRLASASHAPDAIANAPATPPPRELPVKYPPRPAAPAAQVPSVTFETPTIVMKKAMPEPAARPTAPTPEAAPAPTPAVPVAAVTVPPPPSKPAPPPAPPAPAVAVAAPAAPAAAPEAVAAPKPAPPAPKPAPPATTTPVVAGPPPPDTFAADVLSCRSALNAGKIKTAVAACQRAIDARPTAAEPLALLAEAEFTRGRGREALRLANAAVASDPRCADAYVIIGGVQQDLGHREEAFAAYRRYLSISPRGSHAGELRALLASR
jgi:hypothetical protein